MTYGASGKPDRAGGPTDPSRDASRPKALIPSAGDIGIVEHPFVRERHVVIKVVKVGKTMWTVEHWTRSEGGWSGERRRKIGAFHPLPQSVNVAIVSEELGAMGEAAFQDELARRKRYHAAVRGFAQAMSAREGQDRNGLGGDSPASAVGETDAPEQSRPQQ